jgi:hypothetical protein
MRAVIKKKKDTRYLHNNANSKIYKAQCSLPAFRCSRSWYICWYVSNITYRGRWGCKHFFGDLLEFVAFICDVLLFNV